jgi:hypothetical protein
VLVALDEGKLIGIRAFLRWEFIVEGKPLKACRAVDTAVHPNYQGQGIFRKLTLSLIDEIKLEGIDFIYNSPNKESLPGYVKMGWEKWGKLPLKLDFHLTIGKNNHPLQPENWNKIQDLVSKIENNKDLGFFNQTNLKKGFLKWRYSDCPLFPYYFLSDGENYLLFYRIKESQMGREVRITDLFVLNDFGKEVKTQLHKSLKNVQKLSGARFTSFSGLAYSKQNILNMGALPVIKVGPLITVRRLHEEINPIEKDWAWSLGDLEVF